MQDQRLLTVDLGQRQALVLAAVGGGALDVAAVGVGVDGELHRPGELAELHRRPGLDVRDEARAVAASLHDEVGGAGDLVAVEDDHHLAQAGEDVVAGVVQRRVQRCDVGGVLGGDGPVGLGVGAFDHGVQRRAEVTPCGRTAGFLRPLAHLVQRLAVGRVGHHHQ